MQVQLETLSGLERRMNIALPLEAIEALVVERLKRLARNAKIQGFRPGKAPLNVVEMNYGAKAREEVLGEQVQKGFKQAISEHKLRVAGPPRFEQVDQHDNGSFSFCAVFEVYPEVTIGDLTDKEIERPITTVTAVDVDKTITILRQQRAQFVEVAREANRDDRVTIDFSGSIDAIAFDGGTAQDVVFVLGQGKMLAEFEAGVIGLKRGDTRNVEVTFPENYHGKDVAGKKAVFEITVKNVEESQLPEIDENFAKALGVIDGDVQKMRVDVEKNVEREVERRLLARTKEHVMAALLAVTDIQLPKALVQSELVRLAEQTQRNLQERGLNAKDMPFLPDQLHQQAERSVRLGLILAELVNANKLQASPEQVRARIEELADSYEQSQEVVQWYYANPERLEAIASTVLEDKVVEFVLSQAKVVEKSLPFDALMGNNA